MSAEPLWTGWAVELCTDRQKWSNPLWTGRTKRCAISAFDSPGWEGEYLRRRRAGTARCVRVALVPVEDAI